MTFDRQLPALMMTAGLVFSPSLFAFDYDLRGYVGYVGTDTDDEFECTSRACQGVLEDALFYGLSASVQGENLGAQVIVSQDEEEDPDISLAQGTWRSGFMGADLNLRAGKIIVPLGLYGSQRITPTARPGLSFPQSLFLNGYYDLLTLSDEGAGIDLRGDHWGFKSAIYDPEEISTEQSVTVPGQPGPLDFLISDLLGLDLLSGIGGTPPQTVTVQEDHRNKAGYLGLDYRVGGYHADVGWVAQELNDIRINAYNLGFLTTEGRFTSSLEAFQLNIEGQESSLEGLSLNFLYSAEKWQAFFTAVQLDFGVSDSEEYVLGGVYYWLDGSVSTRLNLHRLKGNLPGATQGIDETEVVTLAIAYSWN